MIVFSILLIISIFLNFIQFHDFQRYKENNNNWFQHYLDQNKEYLELVKKMGLYEDENQYKNNRKG